MSDRAKYQVLARRYRPQQFSDVVGQEAILQTLKNAIRRGSIAHAYLFSGSRGVGKTTLARLFAKALNCASLSPQGEPCNHCPSCLDISSAQSLDVIEIDGASNRGIDDIRQINETVGFAPSFGKYKIYIIDEVHMLTKEAFNALLKTLEEPPERAKFFFATTEAHKVLPTILSRCQRFDLGRILPGQIILKLDAIAKDLTKPVEPEALHLIALAADGSLRDAESLFDQILCFSNEAVTASDARSVLGLASSDLFFSFDKAFAESRLSYAFELVGDLFQTGKDLSHFLEQLIEHYRHITVCKTMSPAALGMPQELSAKYAESAAFYTQQQCLSALDILLKADAQIGKSSSIRTTLELALLQILRTKNRIPVEVLVRRLSDLEESLHQMPKVEAEEQSPAATKVPKPPEPAEPIRIKETPVLRAFEPPTPIAEPPKATEPEPSIQAPLPIVETPVLRAYEPPTPIAEPPKATEPREYREIPFNPQRLTEHTSLSQAIPAKPVQEPIKQPQLPRKHQSHYDTLIRFTAVELEGTVKI